MHGLATFAWDAGDEAGRRLAAVQLVRLRAASQGQVAGAFGVDPATIWRWDRRWPPRGWPVWCGPAGPEGASKLTPELVADHRAGAAGATLREIAAATGVSTFSVRTRWAGRGRRAPAAAPPAQRLRSPGTMTRTWRRRFRCCRTRCPGRGWRCPGGCWRGAVPAFSPRARTRWPAAARAARAGGHRLLRPPARSTPLRTGSTADRDAADRGVPGPGRSRGRGATRCRPPRWPGWAWTGAGGQDVRRKLGELAAAGKAAELIMALARRHAAARPDALGSCTWTARPRVLRTRTVQKTHVAR